MNLDSQQPISVTLIKAVSRFCDLNSVQLSFFPSFKWLKGPLRMARKKIWLRFTQKITSFFVFFHLKVVATINIPPLLLVH